MRILVKDLQAHLGQEVELMGFLHWRRDLGKVQFLLLRDRSGVVQVVTGGMRLPLPESSLRVRGLVVESPKAPGGLEVQAKEVEVLSPALEPAPVEIPKEEWRAHPDTLLEYRYVTLRGEKARAPLKVQAALVRGFRRYLDRQDFTEIFTPKVVRAGAEGGSGLFGVDYFEKRAYLAQSPQLYKQIMVGVFERVYEVAPVWRMEEHNTSRHLNEYLSLDVEMGFIGGEEDLMALEEEPPRGDAGGGPLLDGAGDRPSRGRVALPSPQHPPPHPRRGPQDSQGGAGLPRGPGPLRGGGKASWAVRQGTLGLGLALHHPLPQGHPPLLHLPRGGRHHPEL
jgi:nondiscriminating aspartyl-tRNA synthetase